MWFIYYKFLAYSKGVVVFFLIIKVKFKFILIKLKVIGILSRKKYMFNINVLNNEIV